MRGPPPKPTASLKLSGSWRAKTRKDHGAATGTPSAPAHLTEAAAVQWAALVAVLEPMRVLSPSDQIALAQFAEYLARWHNATQQIERCGEVIALRNDANEVVAMKQSPWVRMQLEYGLMIRRYAHEFGLTPSARSGLEVGNGRAAIDTTFSRAQAIA